MELSTYTGNLQYRGVNFSFVFDGQELKLIPPSDKKEEIELEWLMTHIGDGISISDVQLKMDKYFLVGECNENGKKIIFLTQAGENINSYNSLLLVNVVAYIICRSNSETFDRISFNSPEIDCIHPANQAYSLGLNNEWLKTGSVSVNTLSFDSTTTEEQKFRVDDREVDVHFSISRQISSKIGEVPISFSSTMHFHFEQTDDYAFILRLWSIAREFLQFLCYRKNIFFSKVEIATKNRNSQYVLSGTLHIVGETSNTEFDALKKGRLIKQEYISGFEGKILNDIADGKLYTRHVPTTYELGHHIDASRFIMITAAFEWEFRREYPNGVPKKEATEKVEKEANEAIQQLIDSSSGKLKKKYQFLKKLIKSDSLQTEIVRMGNDYDKIIGNFGRGLYQLNDESLKYSEMGDRLANQRNRFAHGVLDKDFIGLSLLDLIYLEYIIYAMQLKHYGIDDERIKKAIRDLFGLMHAF